MPPLRLTSLVQAALPKVSPTSRAVRATLGCLNGHAPPAAEAAAWVGLRDRFQLARVLKADGLPPLEQLAGWVRVLYWVLEAESSGASLLELMQRERLDPATGYRLVRRVTGLRWSEARRAGVSMLLLKLRDRCTARVASARLRAAQQPASLAIAVGDGIVRPVALRGPAPGAPTAVRHPAGVLADRLRLGGSPYDVVIVSPGAACVTRVHAAALDRITLEPLAHSGSLGVGSAPTRIALAPGADRVYVTNQFTEDVAVIDVATWTRTSTIPMAGFPVAAALSIDGRTLYVTTNLDRVYAIEIAQGRVSGMAPIPHTGFDIAVHPSGRWLYLPTWRDGSIVELDARALRVTRTFHVGGVAQDIAISPDGATLYGVNEHGWLDAINLSTGRHATPIPLGAPALNLALSPDHAVLYASLTPAGQVLAVDTTTLAIRGGIATGGRPRRVAFDPVGQYALIANEAGWVDLVR